MIEGLGVIPYVLQHRWEQKSPAFLDCSDCKKRLPAAARQRQGCPYVRDSYGTVPVRGCRVESTVCPGYAIALPQVIEAVSAHAHWDRGQLRDRVGAPTQSLLTYVETYENARAGAEAYFMKPEKDREI